MARAHLESLTARHERLDGEITAEMNRPVPDNVLISRLKREKLKLKEEISSLTA